VRLLTILVIWSCTDIFPGRASQIDALFINEDTTKTADLWKNARTSAAMVYMSPEMALSPNFQKLWKDSRFRTRLTAIVVDEAHCMAGRGGDDFRPAYRLLETLRSRTGFEVPVVACTATCTTKTFDLIWTAFRYGHRPFWGLDVGSDRPNLLHIIRILENPKNSLLDILNFVPNDLTADSPLDAIAKCIYFDSGDACRKAVQFIRKCLPEHLRKSVQAFPSNVSELAKEQCWELFFEGPPPQTPPSTSSSYFHMGSISTAVPQTGPSGLADRRTSHSHPVSSSPQRPVCLPTSPHMPRVSKHHHRPPPPRSPPLLPTKLPLLPSTLLINPIIDLSHEPLPADEARGVAWASLTNSSVPSSSVAETTDTPTPTRSHILRCRFLVPKMERMLD